MTKKQKAYASAGVDVDLGNRLKRGIHSLVRQTHGLQVLGKIGGFGGLFRANFSGMCEPVLVASIDGVGTKLKVAFALDKHDTVGVDLVNHCVNDILVQGALTPNTRGATGIEYDRGRLWVVHEVTAEEVIAHCLRSMALIARASPAHGGWSVDDRTSARYSTRCCE